jgi:NTE family protein
MLGGGGARCAYQAGVLRGIARRFPHVRFPILTGISAGAINTTHLASRESSFPRATDDLVALWLGLNPERVYDVRAAALVRNVIRWGSRLISGGIQAGTEPMRGMVDTEPLREFLNGSLAPATDGSIPGIARNIARGTLDAVAVSATSYATGHSVTWVEGRDIDLWQRPQRRSELTRLTVDHVMASSALPMLFPAVRVGDHWFGDGGVRLTAPLSPALHLGATRILTVSTRHRPAHTETNGRAHNYPPPAQVLGVLYRSVFLDMIDEDISRLRKVNEVVAECSSATRQGWRVVDIFVIRPSQDLRMVVRELELRLPWLVRYMTRGLGTRETTSPDFLSLLLFQSDYIRRLIELGESDVDAQADDIEAFLGFNAGSEQAET